MWPFKKKTKSPEELSKDIEMLLVENFIHLIHRIEDDLYDLIGEDKGLSEELFNKIFDEIVDKRRKELCERVGHYCTIDHCGLPEHDYCLICEVRVPGGAH